MEAKCRKWMKIPSYLQYSDSIWSTWKGHLGARYIQRIVAKMVKGTDDNLVTERREERAVDASR